MHSVRRVYKLKRLQPFEQEMVCKIILNFMFRKINNVDVKVKVSIELRFISFICRVTSDPEI